MDEAVPEDWYVPRTIREVSALFPDWSISCVLDIYQGARFTAVPPDGPIAVCYGSNAEELVTEITRWLWRAPAEVDEHVRRLRETMDEMPENWTRERDFIEQRIKAESFTMWDHLDLL